LPLRRGYELGRHRSVGYIRWVTLECGGLTPLPKGDCCSDASTGSRSIPAGLQEDLDGVEVFTDCDAVREYAVADAVAAP